MHLRTHVAPEHRSPPGLTTRTEYDDGMVEHDGHVGKLLKTFDDLNIADNTVVPYATDNGPHMNTWPGRWPRNGLGIHGGGVTTLWLGRADGPIEVH
jgi:arylsulfatase A-like enzyme